MGAITATDCRISLLPTANPAGAQPNQVLILGKQKQVRFKVEISATKALTYPSSGGIPLPTWNLSGGNGDVSYGMVRNVSHVIMQDMGMAVLPTDPNQKQAMFKYDSQSHVIRGFWETNLASSAALPDATGFAELPTTWKPSMGTRGGLPLTFFGVAYGW
jgi:hypothetical protein